MPSKKQRAKRTKYQNNQFNKKRDERKKQQEQEEEEKLKRFQKETNFVSMEKTKLMELYSKKFSYEYYGYFKNNAIIGCGTDSKKEFHKKMKRYGKRTGKSQYGSVMINDIEYAVDTEVMKVWTKKQASLRFHKEEDFTDEDKSNIREISFRLLIDPPKVNGELFNLSTGFLGSIWIDTEIKGIQYRLALYNQINDEGKADKNYKLGKDFKPIISVIKMNDVDDDEDDKLYGEVMNTKDYRACSQLESMIKVFTGKNGEGEVDIDESILDLELLMRLADSVEDGKEKDEVIARIMRLVKRGEGMKKLIDEALCEEKIKVGGMKGKLVKKEELEDIQVKVENGEQYVRYKK